MKRISFLLLLSSFLPASFAAQWSVGYWTPWGTPSCPISEIDMDALTHIVHWGALVNADGSLDLNYDRITADASALIAAAHAKNVKVLLGVVQPYWLGQTANFQQNAANNRAAFVSNIMSVVNTYGYDGVDLDWEPFDPGSNGAAMRSLATDLRANLGSRLLTAAVIITSYNYWGSVHTLFDRVNVMTYDMSGTWDPYSWHNAALYDTDGMVWSINLAVTRFTAGGVPASKLGIGIPFYGWQWTGGGITAPRQTWSGTPNMSQINYNSLAPLIGQRTYGWDGGAHTPYLSASDSFLSYDNEQSVTDKVNFAKSNNLGGWIIWNVATDYFPAGSPKHPLLTAVKNAMGPIQTATAPVITTGSVAAGTVGTAYSQTLAASGTAPITWSVIGGSLPAGLSISSSNGVLSGTPAASGVSTFTVQAANTAGSNSKSFSLTVAPNAIAPIVTTVSLAAGTVGTGYSQTLTASGTAPINWTIISGSLPAGLWINTSNGIMGGTPTAAGSVTLTVQATNSAGSNSKALILTIAANSVAPFIASASLSAGTVGTAYSQTLSASGTTPITWSVSSGSLPAGLSLNASTGVISGTPTVAAVSSFTIQAANTAGSNSKLLAITVYAAVSSSAPKANGARYLSDLTWTSATSGWGTVQKNRSVAGNPIRLNGLVYSRGLGTHASSQIVYSISGCSTFQANVGIDEESGNAGSVVFSVLADGVQLYQSATLSGASATQNIFVPVSGRSQLTLIVTDAGDGNSNDHADWGNARLNCGGSNGGSNGISADASYYVSDLTPVSAVNGWGAIQKDMSIDGQALKLRGSTYSKGLGAHANSQVVYNLGGACNSFQAGVGVDDETGGYGSVVFKVVADGVTLYQSGVLTGTSAAQNVFVSVAGRSQLTLIADNAGDGIDYDHADWASARLTCSSPPK